MATFKQIVKMDVFNLIKNPVWLFYSIGFPLLLVWVLGFLGETSYSGSVSSYDYFGVTIMLFSCLIASSFSANSFMEEEIKAPNMRLILLPLATSFIPLAKIIAAFLYTMVLYTFDGWLIHVLFKVNYGGQNWWQVWLLLAAVDLLAIVIGVLFCVIFKSEALANQLISLVTQILALLSGCFFPIYALGKGIGKASQFSPITQVINTLFKVIYDKEIISILPVFTVLMCLISGGIVLSILLFKGEDYV